MKKLSLSTLLLVIIASLVLTACGGGEKKPVDGDKKVTKIDIATIYNSKAPPTMGAAKFKELVEQKSNGAITVNLFTSGALGSEKDKIGRAHV